MLICVPGFLVHRVLAHVCDRGRAAALYSLCCAPQQSVQWQL
jgi:hypothetical protein